MNDPVANWQWINYNLGDYKKEFFKCLESYAKNSFLFKVDLECCPIMTDLLFLGLARRIWATKI